jgi:hypothetical protein
MTLFAQQGAVAIENARFHEQGRILAVSEERNRMAREIHDTLAQGFTGIILQLQVAESLLDGEEPAARERLTRAQELARSSLREARRSVWNLRPSSLQGRSLAEALRDHLAEWRDHTGIEAVLHVEGAARPLAPETEETLLRVAQEALNNTYKHAGAQARRSDSDTRGGGGAPGRLRRWRWDRRRATERRGQRLRARQYARADYPAQRQLRYRERTRAGDLRPGRVADHGPPARRAPGSVPA